jgi:magnesium-dependent phosphatase 1
MQKPIVIVFDVDGTIWSPEMYELWGRGGAPFRKNGDCELSLRDKDNNVVQYCHKDLPEIFAAIYHAKQDAKRPIKVATASTCDEPEWARELLRTFTFRCRAGKQHAIGEVFDYHRIITASDKSQHFRDIVREFGCGYEDLVFFDNQMNNISLAKRLGVQCVYTPSGCSWAHWCEVLPREL